MSAWSQRFSVRALRRAYSGASLADRPLMLADATPRFSASAPRFASSLRRSRADLRVFAPASLVRIRASRALVSDARVSERSGRRRVTTARVSCADESRGVTARRDSLPRCCAHRPDDRVQPPDVLACATPVRVSATITRVQPTGHSAWRASRPLRLTTVRVAVPIGCDSSTRSSV